MAFEGLSGEDIADQVFALTVAHDCTSYDDARLFMMDRLDAEQGWLESVYIGARAEWDGTATPGSLNTEHTWPQSQGAHVNPARCDLHHLYPADWGVNSRRSNLRFGRVEDPTWTQAGSSRGLDAEGVTVFEPRDAHKGNAARSLLYYAARYDGVLDRDYMELLIEWSAFDPPDEREVARTFAIAEEQGAVNPYVICPDAVDRL